VRFLWKCQLNVILMDSARVSGEFEANLEPVGVGWMVSTRVKGDFERTGASWLLLRPSARKIANFLWVLWLSMVERVYSPAVCSNRLFLACRA